LEIVKNSALKAVENVTQSFRTSWTSSGDM
jgi:hypothetical protein